MKSRMAKSVFCIAVFVMCSLPLLVFLNVKERFTDLYGFEPPKADMPPLSIRTFADRTFQKSFEDNYARNFFLRKTFLKTRNTLCDYINLSMFHEAYNHTIHEGRGNVLYEVGYLAFHLQARDPGMMRENPTMNLLKKAVLRFAEIGVDVVFVLTPDKVTMYPDEIPAYVNMFGELKSMDTQKAVAKFLCDHGMKAFDADGFLRDRKSKYTERMFPVAGIHWNALAAGLVVEELLQSISREGNRYRFGRFTGVSHTDEAQYGDEDIGRLLNIWHSRSVERNINLLPCFSQERGKSNDGGVLVTGDSFTAQIGCMLLQGKYFDGHKIVTADKRTLTEAERVVLSRDLRCVMVVLNTINAWALVTDVPNGGFIGMLAKDLHDLAFDERTISVSFGDRPELIDAGGETGLQTRGGIVVTNRCFSVKLSCPVVLHGKDWSCDILMDSSSDYAVEGVSCDMGQMQFAEERYDRGTVVTVNLPKDRENVTMAFTLNPGAQIVLKQAKFYECMELDMSKLSSMVSAKRISLGDGFSGLEENGVWTDGSTAKMDIRLGHGGRKGDFFALRFKCSSIVNGQEVSVACEGREIAVWRFDNTDLNVMDLKIPAELVHDGVAALEFRIKSTVCPCEKGWSDDKRHLGINFNHVQVLAERG